MAEAMDRAFAAPTAPDMNIGVTVLGFRSSFKDWDPRFSFANEIVESVLPTGSGMPSSNRTEDQTPSKSAAKS
jgi:hypothetical protein